MEPTKSTRNTIITTPPPIFKNNINPANSVSKQTEHIERTITDVNNLIKFFTYTTEDIHNENQLVRLKDLNKNKPLDSKYLPKLINLEKIEGDKLNKNQRIHDLERWVNDLKEFIKPNTPPIGYEVIYTQSNKNIHMHPIISYNKKTIYFRNSSGKDTSLQFEEIGFSTTSENIPEITQQLENHLNNHDYKFVSNGGFISDDYRIRRAVAIGKLILYTNDPTPQLLEELIAYLNNQNFLNFFIIESSTLFEVEDFNKAPKFNLDIFINMLRIIIKLTATTDTQSASDINYFRTKQLLRLYSIMKKDVLKLNLLTINIQLFPNNCMLNYHLGMHHYLKKEFKEALCYLTKAEQLHDEELRAKGIKAIKTYDFNSIKLYNLLRYIYSKPPCLNINKKNKYINLAYDLGSAEAAFEKAQSMIEQKKFDQAIPYLEKSDESKSKSVQAKSLEYHGEFCVRNKHFTQAQACFKRRAGMLPRTSNDCLAICTALANVIKIFLYEGKFEEAEEYISKFEKEAPIEVLDTKDFNFIAGQTYHLLKNHAKVEEFLVKVPDYYTDEAKKDNEQTLIETACMRLVSQLAGGYIESSTNLLKQIKESNYYLRLSHLITIVEPFLNNLIQIEQHKHQSSTTQNSEASMQDNPRLMNSYPSTAKKVENKIKNTASLTQGNKHKQKLSIKNTTTAETPANSTLNIAPTTTKTNSTLDQLHSTEQSLTEQFSNESYTTTSDSTDKQKHSESIASASAQIVNVSQQSGTKNVNSSNKILSTAKNNTQPPQQSQLPRAPKNINHNSSYNINLTQLNNSNIVSLNNILNPNDATFKLTEYVVSTGKFIDVNNFRLIIPDQLITFLQERYQYNLDSLKVVSAVGKQGLKLIANLTHNGLQVSEIKLLGKKDGRSSFRVICTRIIDKTPYLLPLVAGTKASNPAANNNARTLLKHIEWDVEKTPIPNYLNTLRQLCHDIAEESTIKANKSQKKH